MALKACHECGQQISTEAKTCPSCGAENPQPDSPQRNSQTTATKRGMSAGKAILIAIGLLTFGTLGTCAVCTVAVGTKVDEVQRNSEKRAAEARIELKKTLADCAKIEALPWGTVAEAMKDNEAKVVAMWKGKCAKISGVVERIDSGLDDRPFVMIGTGQRITLGGLHCKPKDDAKARALSKGQRITVWGIGGNEMMGSLFLEHCDW